jgi:hypothetical protein
MKKRIRKSNGAGVTFVVQPRATLIATPNTAEGFLVVGGACLVIGLALLSRGRPATTARWCTSSRA